MRRLLATLILIVLATPQMGDAWAQASVCAELRSQLASLPPTDGGGNALVQQQLNEIQKARNDLRRLNCTSIEAQTNRDKMASCDMIANAIQSMEQNYMSLSRNSGGNRTATARADIMVQMRSARCDLLPQNPAVQQQQAPQQQQPDANSEGNFLSWLFGRFQGRQQGQGNANNQMQNGDPMGDPNAIGSAVRTLCVRTCDGYYWPVSFSTSSRAFDRDENICRQMCPTQETQLFYHHVPGQWSENMVSVDGTPYKSMSYAFAYRQSYNPSCSCRPQKSFDLKDNNLSLQSKPDGNSGDGVSVENGSATAGTSQKILTPVPASPSVTKPTNEPSAQLAPVQTLGDRALSTLQQVQSRTLSTPENLDVDIRAGGRSGVNYNALQPVPLANGR